MADLEGNYLQAPLGGVDAQPFTHFRRYKVGAGLLVGACLFLGIATTSITASALQSNGKANSLISFARATRSAANSPSLTMRRDFALKKLAAYGISPSPMESLALTALAKADQIRDVSMRAEGKSGGNAVTLKAQDMAGVTGPLGFFDPLGFSTDCSAGKLLFYREVELKHGRVGMLAALGFLVGENFHPLFGGEIDVPSYVAFQQTPLQTFWGSVLAAIAIPEVFSVLTFQDPGNGERWSMREDRRPGEFSFDPLGLKPTDKAEFKEMQTKELNNGRLAMLAAAGMIAQELATGQKLFG